MASETTQTSHPSPSEAKAMEKLERVTLQLAETHPNSALTPSAKTHLLNRLNHFFSHHKTPHHPPYSHMIERAIRELNEKGGSSEESICKYVEKEYKDVLPLHHSDILNHHLAKLSQSHYIVARIPHRYTLLRPKSSTNFAPTL